MLVYWDSLNIVMKLASSTDVYTSNVLAVCIVISVLITVITGLFWPDGLI